MPRHELNKDSNSSHAKVDRGKWTTIEMPKEMGKAQETSTLHKEPHATRKSKSGRNNLLHVGRSLGKGKIIIKMYYTVFKN